MFKCLYHQKGPTLDHGMVELMKEAHQKIWFWIHTRSPRQVPDRGDQSLVHLVRNKLTEVKLKGDLNLEKMFTIMMGQLDGLKRTVDGLVVRVDGLVVGHNGFEAWARSEITALQVSEINALI